MKTDCEMGLAMHQWESCDMKDLWGDGHAIVYFCKDCGKEKSISCAPSVFVGAAVE